MNKTTRLPFDVYTHATPTSEPQFIQTIQIEVETRFGEEYITPESRRAIELVQARHMGIMTGDDIKALRQRLKLKQQELTELIDCGDKTLSRWENDRGFPTGANNTLLRLLFEDRLSPADLRAARGPLPKAPPAASSATPKAPPTRPGGRASGRGRNPLHDRYCSDSCTPFDFGDVDTDANLETICFS